MKRILAIAFIVFSFSATAQSFQPSNGWLKGDSGWFTKDRIHYLGIQSNLLLQQFISFNSNSSINTNPYLFSYSSTNRETGTGFAMGTGLSVNQNASNDGVASITVSNTNVSVRLGWEKKYLQDHRFIPFIGVDGAMGVVANNTTSVLNQSFNSNIVRTRMIKFFLGPSFRGGLNYAVTKHILVGTEFYFNLHIAYSETEINNGGFFSNVQETSPFNIGFQPPTAVYMIFRY
jgi:hypothetical protein